MINYLPPTSDYSSICRNKSVQASPWLSTITILYNPLGLNPLVKDQNVYVFELGLETLLLSASNIEYTSDFNPDSQVYSHKFSCVIYNSDYHYLQSIQSFLQENKFSLSISDGLTDYFIGVEGCQLQSSIVHNSQEQSLSLIVQALSSYNILPYSSVPYVPPITPVKHIRGTLDPAYVSNGGFTVNSEAYYYQDLELDENNAFDVQLPEDTIIHAFDAEWSYGSQSPLLSIDLSEFDGQETITSLAYAFKGNSNLQYVTLPSCSSVTTYEECFRDCSDLISVNGVPSYNGVTSFKRCFQNCSSLQEFSFGHWNIQSEPDCSYMFANCSSLTTVDHSKLVTISKMDSMFASCISLETMNLYSKVWYVTSATDTFYGCTHLSDLSLWGMDPQRVSPGQYSSNGFFPLGQDGYHVLTVDFNPSHAHGYNVTKLNNNSLSNYLNVLAHVPATLAGSSNDLTITAAQGSYIDANYPSLLNYVRDQGWLVYYTN